MQRFTTERVLAKALYGQVLLCTDKTTKKQVAIKRMNIAAATAKTSVKGRKIAEDISMEKTVNRALSQGGSHPNILCMKEDFVEDDHEHFVFDLCAKGELYGILDSSFDGKFDDDVAKRYFRQVVQGVMFLHKKGFAHRDLSLENVLVDEDDNCHVCDFGLATPANVLQTQSVGKKFYMAPEVVQGTPYDPIKADVWSLGIMLYIMLTGGPMFDMAQHIDSRYKYFVTNGLRSLVTAWGFEICPEALSLLESMLQVDPSARCSLDQVLAHEYLRTQPQDDCAPSKVKS